VRRDIEFTSGTDTVRGWLYLPDEGDGPFPVVVMAGGWCYVKEIVQPTYAEMFARAGYAAVLFDYRNFGDSGGARRQHIDPHLQIEDYRNAISFAETLEEVDPDRIGVWGCPTAVVTPWSSRPSTRGSSAPSRRSPSSTGT